MSVPKTLSSIGGIAAAIGCGLLLLLNGVDAAAGVTCGTKEVVIVGAGFSGLGAAKELIDTGGFTADDYVIIEMTNRNGGRVSSVQPANFNGVWIEEGASWLNGEDNPVFELMRQYGKEFTLQNFYDYKIFDYDGNDKTKNATRLNMDGPTKRNKDFNAAYYCMEIEAEKQLDPSLGTPPVDNGLVAFLGRPECGWTASTNVDFAIQWQNIDYEYTQNDVSLATLPTSFPRAYLVKDQNGGFQSMVNEFVNDQEFVIDYGKKVTAINYDYSDPSNQGYKVRIDIVASDASCDHYLANYVILTVPTGVLEQKRIQFTPTLYNDDNPHTMGQYVKIFYKFDFRVGPRYKNEFLYAVLQGSGSIENNNRCISWQNMDAKRNNMSNGTSINYIPGANIWMCTLTTEGFDKLLSEGDGERLSAAQIDDLLDPLRRVFPERRISTDDYDYYYPDWNLRESTGNGAFGNWKVGYSLRDYYEYFGGGPVEYCNHNGCDSNGVWRLHISGTASCYAEWELAQGGYYSGQRSARYILAETGEDVDVEFLNCENLGENFVLPPPVE